MRKSLIIAFIAIVSMGNGLAQDYTTSVGLRGGLANGITLKHFIGETNAIEGIVSARWRGVNLTGLFEIHKGRVAEVEYLNWYYGFGGHVGTWKDAVWYNDGNRHIAVGVDGIIGLEYTLTEFDLPFNVSIDYKPAINFGYKWFTPDEIAVSIRYILK